MADDFDYALDDNLDFDEDGWMYVEDADNPVDDLVENVVPSPGYTGVNENIFLMTDDFDPLAYFEDLEYGDDTYYDGPSRREQYEQEKKADNAKAGKKRERSHGKAPAARSKRQKPSPAGEDMSRLDLEDPVIFVPIGQRCRLSVKLPPIEQPLTFALLPDWRTRFHGDSTPQMKEMPAEMRNAAQSVPTGTPSRSKHLLHNEPDSEEWEDEEAEGNGDAEGNSPGTASTDLDMDLLKMVLKQRLGAAGLSDANETAFMATLQQMLAGGGDQAAAELADTLLGQATNGNSDLSGWLSGQGVGLDTIEEESVAGDTLTDSPIDSAVALSDTGPCPPETKVPNRLNRPHRPARASSGACMLSNAYEPDIEPAPPVQDPSIAESPHRSGKRKVDGESPAARSNKKTRRSGRAVMSSNE